LLLFLTPFLHFKKRNKDALLYNYNITKL
jgi:hypothetical protein